MLRRSVGVEAGRENREPRFRLSHENQWDQPVLRRPCDEVALAAQHDFRNEYRLLLLSAPGQSLAASSGDIGMRTLALCVFTNFSRSRRNSFRSVRVKGDSTSSSTR